MSLSLQSRSMQANPGNKWNRDRSPRTALQRTTIADVIVVIEVQKDQPTRYWNPLTFSHQSEEELWASCGNWDL